MSNAIVLEMAAGTIVGAGAAALVLAVGSAGAQYLIPPQQDSPQITNQQSAAQVACIGVDVTDSAARPTGYAALGARHHASSN